MRIRRALSAGGSNGLSDAPALANFLRELIDCPERRRLLGQAGLDSVRERYTYDAIAVQLYNILAKACGKINGQAATHEATESPAPLACPSVAVQRLSEASRDVAP